MEKHASFKQYTTRFDPLPMERGTALFDDRGICILPRVEDFPYLHYHEYYEVGLCVSGTGLFLCEGRLDSVSEGDCILIRPGQRHFSRSLSADFPCGCRFLYLLPDAVHALLGESCRMGLATLLSRIPPVIHHLEYPDTTVLLRELVRRSERLDASVEASVLLRFALFLTEAEHIFSAHPDRLSPTSAPEDELIAQAAEYLSLHYDEALTARELAARVHLSESQLRRRFVASYGIPPISYRNALRCRIGAELLRHTRLSVGEIGERIGFTDPSDFYRAFCARYGRSPIEYRKKG